MKIIFINNGPYDNHGCEAIVRGTCELLNQEFGKIEYINIAHFVSLAQVAAHNDKDKSHIVHVMANRFNRNRAGKLFGRLLRYFSSDLYYKLGTGHLRKIFEKADLVLSIGGDNYSLDYGYPYNMIYLDYVPINLKVPTVIWGASIGPFASDPTFEGFMAGHLKKFSLIFMREEESASYLRSIGVNDNVVLSSDPAFLMTPRELPCELPKHCIGINFSPLISKLSNKTEQDVVREYAHIVDSVVEHTQKHVVLIPHVNKKGNSDYILLKNVLHACKIQDKIILIEDRYDAQELKSIISQMEIFVGARTHATIAAMSSGIPTLSLSYSIKSIGINKRLFDSTDYVLGVNQINAENILAKIDLLYCNYDKVVAILRSKIRLEKENLLRSALEIKKLLQ